MYFASRKQAGRMLARQVAEKYPDSDCSVVALSDGGVVVGMEIARELQSVITMLLIGQINLPQESVAIAGITQNGSFSYNQSYSSGEIEELSGEYRGLIEQEKFDRIREMNDLGSTELIRKDLLHDRNIILVSDGLTNGFSLDLAQQYLKPIAYKKLIIATPLASVIAVDRMHILADDIFCLNVLEEFISVDHYYDVNDTPEHDVVVRTVSQIVHNWQ